MQEFVHHLFLTGFICNWQKKSKVFPKNEDKAEDTVVPPSEPQQRYDIILLSEQVLLVLLPSWIMKENLLCFVQC